MNTKPSILPITVLITGGTLDKNYNTISGELTFFQSHLPQLLNEANHSLPLTFKTLMLKDSLDMHDDDRDTLYQACKAAQNKHLVITHGTDTMSRTAQYLCACPQLTDKTIILTGAMRPFMLGQSDASFNIGSALMAVQLTQPGVYIAMNGQLFSAQETQKNRQTGRFEAK